jgi:hypothetical protein
MRFASAKIEWLTDRPCNCFDFPSWSLWNINAIVPSTSASLLTACSSRAIDIILRHFLRPLVTPPRVMQKSCLALALLVSRQGRHLFPSSLSSTLSLPPPLVYLLSGAGVKRNQGLIGTNPLGSMTFALLSEISGFTKQSCPRLQFAGQTTE